MIKAAMQYAHAICWFKVSILQGNLFYQEVRIPKDANATGIFGEHWFNPVYLPYNPGLIQWSYIVSFIQATSHMFVPQMPPYITGVPHRRRTYMAGYLNTKANINAYTSVWLLFATQFSLLLWHTFPGPILLVHKCFTSWLELGTITVTFRNISWSLPRLSWVAILMSRNSQVV